MAHQSKFGGFDDVPAPAAHGLTGQRKSTSAVRPVLEFLSLVGAVAAGIYTYVQEPSIWLSVFVAGGVLYVVGAALPEIVTNDKKLRRALYFVLVPAIAVAILVLAYAAWETWWLAAIVSWVGTALISGLLAPLVFPGIRREQIAAKQLRQRG